MTAFGAGIGHPNTHGREFIKRREEAAVRAGIGAISLRAEEVDREKAADKKERNPEKQSWKGGPKIGCRK